MIPERLSRLREKMKEANVDLYMVTSADFHASEYVGDYFKARAYITGFTGSAGTAVITQDGAWLWTDGRYFIQAAAQLSGTTVTLQKMGQDGIPTVEEFILDRIRSGETLGFDGRTVSAAEGEKYARLLAKKGAKVASGRDLVGEIWQDRPALSAEPVFELDVRYAGQERSEKLHNLFDAMDKEGADALVLTSLDDIAWLLNIRGGDVAYNPVVLSYLLAKKDHTVYLYANSSCFPEAVVHALEKDGVTIRPYNNIYTDIAAIPAGSTLMADKSRTNYAIVGNVPEGVTLINRINPTYLPKSIKNPTEVENEKLAHIKDGVAMTRFIYWLKTHIGKEKITEMSAAAKIESFRQMGENYLGQSFAPIVSYGAHAAMCHYSPSAESDIEIEPHGFALADTGGQYYEGTTDITRTFAVGPLSYEQKHHYTLVLRGHLHLAAARFLYGCTGVALDYACRAPLWDEALDYNHGTGHGVGYLLNVHEGPNSFRYRIVPDHNAVMEEGMITSNEPGLYLEGKYGIRIENMIVCRKDVKNEYGQFMAFDNLTYIPYEPEAVLPEEMTEKERALYNDYMAQVYEKISPYLSEEEKVWLKNETRPI